MEDQTDDNEHASLTSECRAPAAETKFAFILSVLIVVSHVNKTCQPEVSENLTGICYCVSAHASGSLS